MKIKIWVSTWKVGSKCEHEIEIDDEEEAEMTDDDIEEIAHEEMFQMIDWGWKRNV